MILKIKSFSLIGGFLLISLMLSACNGATTPVSSQNSSSKSSSLSLSSSSTSSSSSAKSSRSSVSASSVAPIPQLKLVYAINAGSTVETTMNEVKYLPDRFSTGGTVFSSPDPVSGVSEFTLYQTERYGQTFGYEIPVTNASYTVILHFAERYQTSAGGRSFSVSVEGNTELSKIDLYSLVGHDGAFEYVFEGIKVSDGKLTINLNADINNATIGGIAIFSDNGGMLAQ